MSTNKSPRLRKVSERVFPAPRRFPLELLLRPSAECPTTDLIAELSLKAKAAARGMRHQTRGMSDDNKPEEQHEKDQQAMSDEERLRQMNFILTQQAQLVSTLGRLAKTVDQLSVEVDRTADSTAALLAITE